MRVLKKFSKNGVKLEDGIKQFDNVMKDHRAFYVVSTNADNKRKGNPRDKDKKILKVGVASKVDRLKTYVKHAGTTDKSRPCTGAKLHYLAISGVNKNNKDYRVRRYETENMEAKIKQDLKGNIHRGTEWVNIKPEKLEKIIKRNLPKATTTFAKKPNVVTRAASKKRQTRADTGKKKVIK